MNGSIRANMFEQKIKKALIIYKSHSYRIDFIKNILNKEFEVTELSDDEQIKTTLAESFNDLDVLIIDRPSLNEYSKEYMDYIASRNNYMFSLPVLALSEPQFMKEDDPFIVCPIVGIVSTSDTENIILMRINNCIKFSSSTNFDDFSEMLRALPSLIYLKDVKGRYAFCSQNWHHLEKQGESVRGKTDFDIRKDKKNARIAMESDMEVIKTGVGKSYVIKEEDEEEGLDYLQIIKEPLKNKKGEVFGIIAIVNNVTDQELLRQELRVKSITDQLTGVYNRTYFEELINREDNVLQYPLTIISTDCDGLKGINDKFGHSAGDQYICFARDALKECLPRGSYLFRMGGDEFIALVPSMGKEKASHLVEKINKTSKKYKNDHFELNMSVGSYTIDKDKGTIENAVILSDKEMYKIKRMHRRNKQKAAE